MPTRWVMGQMEFVSGKTQKAVAVEHVQYLIHHAPKGLELFIPFAIQPIGKITPDSIIYLVIDIGPNPRFLKIGQLGEKK